jgi:tRNA U34 5-methylaminomethyl-2-thiouridine-forming methyltransferase MnmC
VGKLTELLKQLQLERHLQKEIGKGESVLWEQMENVLEQVCTLSAKKEHSVPQVSDLESKLAELKSQLVERLPPQPPAGPLEAERWLQQDLENLADQLQAQVQENEKLCLLNQEQEEQLSVLEQAAEVWNQQAEDCKKLQETMEDNGTTISCAPAEL